MGIEVIGGGWGAEAVRGLRLGIAGVAACVVVTACGWLVAGRALAAGDANESGCPAATESSPGYRVGLPDCRAYEIVSEANSNDTENLIGAYGFPDGKHVFYMTGLPTVGSEPLDSKTEHFLATRRPAGWEQQVVSPPEGEGPTSQINTNVDLHSEEMAFAADLSEAFAMSPFRVPGEDPRLNETSNATVNVLVYGLSLTSGTASLQSLPDSGSLTQEMIETPTCKELAKIEFYLACGAFLAGASSDGSRVFFVTSMKLPTAPGTPHMQEPVNQIYERTGGRTYLVGVLPNGSAASCGAEVGEGVIQPEDYSYGAVAPSGANVVFTANNCVASGLYLRDLLDGTTVQLPGGPSAGYVGRAGTGVGEEEVIFTVGEGKLYAYHVTSGQSTEFGEGAIGLLAWSGDGSRVYYLGPKEEIDVWHDGEAKPIPGTEAGGYTVPGSKEQVLGGGRIPASPVENMPVASGGSSEGSHLIFIDRAQLTSYENDGHMEAYLYDAQTEKVTCISCNPTGASPLAQKLDAEQGNAQLIGYATHDTTELNFLPSAPPFVSEDGSRAVFETSEALVPQDVNGVDDVYEWEREGTEGCDTESLHVKNLAESGAYSPVNEGCVYLLSSGVGGESGGAEPTQLVSGTHLVGASENLGDVYMQSDEPLLPGLDNAAHLYDVRVDGGFPYTPPPSHGCEPGQCKTAMESPLLTEPASITFTGAGNMKPVAARSARKAAHTLTRRQRLRKALKRCRRIKSRRRRRECERRARRLAVSIIVRRTPPWSGVWSSMASVARSAWAVAMAIVRLALALALAVQCLRGCVQEIWRWQDARLRRRTGSGGGLR